ncbi:MAG TPA: hypothetical protein VG099_16540, partial [Gemmataceae bacterium]|nr:hypothetical protein [Gemmataceae bacterium]
MLAALVAGVIAAAIIQPVIFPGGNELVNYSNYLALQKQRKTQKQIPVEEVEVMLGPAAQIFAAPNSLGIRETRLYVGQRDRGNRRDRVTVDFANGKMWRGSYECVHDPPLFTWISEK